MRAAGLRAEGLAAVAAAVAVAAVGLGAAQPAAVGFSAVGLETPDAPLDSCGGDAYTCKVLIVRLLISRMHEGAAH